MPRSPLVILLLSVALLSGCASRLPSPWEEHPDRPLPSDHPRLDLSTFLELPEDARRERRDACKDDLEALAYHRGQLRHEWQLEMKGMTIVSSARLRGAWRIGRLMRRLQRVTGTDPTSAEAWYVLGRLRALTGDPVGAAVSLDGAWAALPHDDRGSFGPDLRQRIRLESAWVARDRGLWDEGLEWLDLAGEKWTRDTVAEARLVRGLLLAGAGRFREARAIAHEVGPVGFPADGLWPRGIDKVGPWYAASWIEAMAWHAIGEDRLAGVVLSRARSIYYWLPFHDRFFDDVGLIHEANGRFDAARSAYFRAAGGLPTLRRFIPWTVYSVGPLVGERPDPSTPLFVCWDERRLAGSEFSHACSRVGIFHTSEDAAARDRAAVRAEAALDRCIRRKAAPDRARALRGRLRYSLGRFAEAEVDLRSAHAAFADAGSVDAGTDLVLAAILLRG